MDEGRQVAQERPTLRQRLAKLITGEYDFRRVRRGEVREATILEVGDNDIVVDLGVKRDGIVPRTDLDLLDEAYRAGLKVGDRVPVVVLRMWGRNDSLVVSINKGLQQADWLRAQDLLEREEVVEACVTGVNRGGVLISFGRLEGFVPDSHLSSIPRGLRGERRWKAKEQLVGETLSVVPLEVKQRRRRLVFSQRLADRQKRQHLLEELAEGDVRTGLVSNLVDFGAFVDLGGIDGLIHVSELDWQHIGHPREVLNVGDLVEVVVLSVDRERERIGLSRKRLLPEPWERVTEALNAGQVTEGTVTNVVEFGAFVDLGEGVEGLVHVSEMPSGAAMFGELDPGSTVNVRVLEVDPERRRISLSLKGAVPDAVEGEPPMAAAEEVEDKTATESRTDPVPSSIGESL
jgi:small subunit ribosomal protein S1